MESCPRDGKMNDECREILEHHHFYPEVWVDDGDDDDEQDSHSLLLFFLNSYRQVLAGKDQLVDAGRQEVEQKQ